MALDYLLVLYRDPVPTLNTFVRYYQKGALSHSGSQVQSHMFEYSVQFIGHALTTMGALDPRLTSKGELDIQLLFK